MFQTWTSELRFLQRFARSGQAVDRDHVHRHPSSRAEPCVGCPKDQDDLTAGAADENGIGPGKVASTSGARPRTGRTLGTPNDSALASIKATSAGSGADRVDHPLNGQLGRLDGDRLRAGPDVPDHAVRPDVELSQGDRADLGLE